MSGIGAEATLDAHRPGYAKGGKRSSAPLPIAMPYPCHSWICLQFRGDTLDPDEVDQALGVLAGISAPGAEPGSTGLWSLCTEPDDAADVGQKIAQMLFSMVADTVVWRGLASRFSGRLICYVAMADTRTGFRIATDIAGEVAARGLHLDVVIEREQST